MESLSWRVEVWLSSEKWGWDLCWHLYNMRCPALDSAPVMQKVEIALCGIHRTAYYNSFLSCIAHRGNSTGRVQKQGF
jgi:hypothetical protein